MKNILATEKLIKSPVKFMMVSDGVIMPPEKLIKLPDMVIMPPNIIMMATEKLIMLPDMNIMVPEKLMTALFAVIMGVSIGYELIYFLMIVAMGTRMTRIELIITDFSCLNVKKISVYLLHPCHPRSHYSKRRPPQYRSHFSLKYYKLILNFV